MTIYKSYQRKRYGKNQRAISMESRLPALNHCSKLGIALLVFLVSFFALNAESAEAQKNKPGVRRSFSFELQKELGKQVSPEAEEKVAPENQETPESIGSVDAHLFEALIGFDPVASYMSLNEYFSTPKPERSIATSNREIKNLRSIEDYYNAKADPNFARQESVCGSDQRVRVSNTKAVPWRWNCQLIITMPDGKKYLGTGFMIGPTTVLTAGHNLHEGGTFGKWATKIEVIPGRNGWSRPYGSFFAKRAHSVDGWVKDRNPNYDYGALTLRTNIGRRTGFYRVASLSTNRIKNGYLNSAGYPADKTYGNQYYVNGSPSYVLQKKIYYHFDTYGGQSGSAVYLKNRNRRTVVGVHAYGGCPNSATRIDAAAMRNIRFWRRIR